MCILVIKFNEKHANVVPQAAAGAGTAAGVPPQVRCSAV